LVEVVTDRPEERFAKGKSLRIGDRELTVRDASRMPKGYLVAFEGVSTRNEAEALRGEEIFALRDELESGEFYHDQLLGISVVTEEGRSLGILREIIPTGANDVYKVGTDEQSYLIPAITDVIVGIDEAARTITIREIEGLLE
jgi:16S rRNA processing protein RimM